MTRRLPYRTYARRIRRLQRARRITPARHTHLWCFSLLVAALLWMVTLPSCRTPSTHPKVVPYTTAVDAEKIDINLLRLADDVRRTGSRLDTTAAQMGIATVSGGIQLELIVQPLEASLVRKIQALGVAVRHVSWPHQRLSVAITDLALLYRLAQMPEVLMILPEYGATTHHGVGGDHPLQPGDPFHVH